MALSDRKPGQNPGVQSEASNNEEEVSPSPLLLFSHSFPHLASLTLPFS
jgi:hypothetical protein